MPDVLDVLPGMIEQVRNKGSLPMLFQEAPNLVMGLIGNPGEVETNVTQKFYRIPFKKMKGGNFGKLGLNYGAFGDGNSFVLDNLTAGYFAFGQSHGLNMEVMETANKAGGAAVVDAFAMTMADANDVMQQHMECIVHTSGNGAITDASSNYSSQVFTFDGASDYVGVNRVLEGMTIEVWNSTLTTSRGITRVTVVDHDAKQATVADALAGATTGDRFVIRDIDTYGPATPTTQASAYPSSGANGVGGDSFIHGLEYYLDTNSANYVLGKQKSSIPQLNPKHIAAGSTALTYLHGIRIMNKVRRSRGSVSNLIGLVPVAQTEHLMAINMALQTTRMDGDRFGKIKDLAPDQLELGDSFTFAGITCRTDLRQRENRIQYIDPSLWGKVQPIPIDFYTAGGGPLYRTLNASGKMTTGVEFHLWGALDYYCTDCGKQAVIDGLTTPTDSW